MPSSEALREENRQRFKVINNEKETILDSNTAQQTPFLLGSFGNQVGGRARLLSYDATTICKPYVSRELFFYYYLPNALREFTPQFRGLVSVSLIETANKELLTYALPNTILHPWSPDILPLIEEPKPHSKRCVRDYGRSHVIYPSNPEHRNDVIQRATDDVIRSLSLDIINKLSIQEELDVEEKELAIESYGLQNPWNSKVTEDALLKLTHENEPRHRLEGRPKIKRCILLENITSPYRHPCVLDLKMGTRVRENPSPAKLARHVTAIELGIRLSGMQIYLPAKNTFSYVNKYYGHNLMVGGLEAKLLEFFSRGNSSLRQKTPDEKSDVIASKCVDKRLVDSAMTKLMSLRNAVRSLESYRFYSCSMLLIYEGDLTSLPPPSGEHGVLSPSKKPSTISAGGDIARVTKSADSQLPTAAAKPFLLRTSPNERSAAHLQSGPHSHLKRTEDAGSPAHDRDATGLLPKNGEGDAAELNDSNEAEKDSFCDDQEIVSPQSKTAPQAITIGSTAAGDQKSGVDLRLIDFAHFCSQDHVVHPGPDSGFLFGLDRLMELLRSMVQ